MLKRPPRVEEKKRKEPQTYFERREHTFKKQKLRDDMERENVGQERIKEEVDNTDQKMLLNMFVFGQGQESSSIRADVVEVTGGEPASRQTDEMAIPCTITRQREPAITLLEEKQTDSRGNR